LQKKQSVMADLPDPQLPSKASRKNRWDTPASSASAALAVAQSPLALRSATAVSILSATAGSSSLLASNASAADLSASLNAAKEKAKEALAKAQLAADVQRALAQHQASLTGGMGGVAGSAGGPATVTIDGQGRLLDQGGKVIRSTPRPQTTMKVNQVARPNPLLEQEAPPDLRGNPYFDPRMEVPGQARDQRKKRAFSFVLEGYFARKGDDLRAKAAVECMVAEANKPAAKRKAAVSALARAAGDGEACEGSGSGPTAVSARTLERRLAEVPGAEWWDLPLLNAASYGEKGVLVDAHVVLDGISHLIEHPVPIVPPAEPPPAPPMPLPLTKKERKKLRTQRRLAAEKEKQDKIRCGLIAPPPPKVKFSNLMSTMKDEAVADPSAVEAKVRAEMAQRIKNHEMRNQARKLTPAERKAKKHRKITNDQTGGGVPVSLYRIDQMPSQQKLYKIDKNAQQNHLTGMLVLMEECTVLIVEGGPKAQKRYRKLLMHRIEWADAPLEDEEDEEELERVTALDVCKLIWEGFVVRAHFRTFRVEAARAVEAARKLLKEKKCEHYLDMALRFGTGSEEEGGSSDDNVSNEDEGDEDRYTENVQSGLQMGLEY
jgi:U4/U6 small nuclear ribonucleoprotein PRP3